MFWAYLERKRRTNTNIDWRCLTNEIVRVWRNELEAELRGSTNKVARQQNTILAYRNHLFNFLYWAHKKGYLKVPMDDPANPETATQGVLSIHEVAVNREFKGFLEVPTDQEITKVMNMISAHSRQRTAPRNLLMFRWASEAGLRNSEIRSLVSSMLPPRAMITIWLRDGITPAMKVKGKGEKIRIIEPPISLLMDTYAYLDEIEELSGPSWASKGKHIFHGRDFGELDLSYVSHLFAHFFAMAGLDSHLHRARAYYVFKVVEGKVQELAENGNLDELHIASILRFVADRVGHEDIKTLRYYISLAVLRISAAERRIIAD